VSADVKTAVFIGVLSFFLLVPGFLLVRQDRTLSENWQNYCRAITENLCSRINKTLEQKDDLELLAEIDRIRGTYPVTDISVIDSDGLIIANTGSEKIGGRIDSPVARQTILENKMIFRQGKERFDFTVSAPAGIAGTCGTVVFEISGQKLRQECFEKQQLYFILSGTALLLGIAGACVFFRRQFSRSIRRAEDAEMQRYEYWKNLLNRARESERKRCQATAEMVEQGLIIVDDNNQVLALNKNAAEKLKIRNSRVKHLMELSKDSEFFKLLEAAVSEKGKIRKGITGFGHVRVMAPSGMPDESTGMIIEII